MSSSRKELLDFIKEKKIPLTVAIGHLILEYEKQQQTGKPKDREKAIPPKYETR